MRGDLADAVDVADLGHGAADLILALEAVDGYVVAAAGEFSRNRQAYAACRAGDQCHTPWFAHVSQPYRGPSGSSLVGDCFAGSMPRPVSWPFHLAIA
jgi:hypothetical protein